MKPVKETGKAIARILFRILIEEVAILIMKGVNKLKELHDKRKINKEK